MWSGQGPDGYGANRDENMHLMEGGKLVDGPLVRRCFLVNNFLVEEVNPKVCFLYEKV